MSRNCRISIKIYSEYLHEIIADIQLPFNANNEAIIENLTIGELLKVKWEEQIW
jgi:hypothetical protein